VFGPSLRFNERERIAGRSNRGPCSPSAADWSPSSARPRTRSARPRASAGRRC